MTPMRVSSRSPRRTLRPGVVRAPGFEFRDQFQGRARDPILVEIRLSRGDRSVLDLPVLATEFVSSPRRAIGPVRLDGVIKYHHRTTSTDHFFVPFGFDSTVPKTFSRVRRTEIIPFATKRPDDEMDSGL